MLCLHSNVVVELNVAVYYINVVLIKAKSVYFRYCVGGYSCFNMYANTADMAVGKKT